MTPYARERLFHASFEARPATDEQRRIFASLAANEGATMAEHARAVGLPPIALVSKLRAAIRGRALGDPPPSQHPDQRRVFELGVLILYEPTDRHGARGRWFLQPGVRRAFERLGYVE